MTAAAQRTVQRCPKMQGLHQCARLAGHKEHHILAAPPARGWAKPTRISDRTRYALAIGLAGLTAIVALTRWPTW